MTAQTTTRDGYCFECGIRPQLARVTKCRECTQKDADKQAADLAAKKKDRAIRKAAKP